MEMDFNIPAQTLSSALKTFAEETGLQMLYSSDAVKGIRSSRVNVKHQAKEALDILLSGTGLSFKFTDSNTVVVQKNKGRKGGKLVTQREVEKREPAEEKEEAKRPVEMEQMTVTATKTKIKVREVPTSVSIVTPEDIKTMPKMNTFYEAIQNVPGVFSHGDQLKIRGNPASIMINGRHVQMFYYDMFNLASLDMGAVERIDVLRGPQSGVHGSRAIGGAANIITKRGDKENPYAEVFALIGDGKEVQAGVRFSGGVDKLSYYFNIAGADQCEFDTPKGEIDYTYSERQNFYGRLDYELFPEHEISLEYTYNEGETCGCGIGAWRDDYPSSKKFWLNGPQRFYNGYLTYNGKFSDMFELFATAGAGKTKMGWIYAQHDDDPQKVGDLFSKKNEDKHDEDSWLGEIRLTANILPEDRLRVLVGAEHKETDLRWTGRIGTHYWADVDTDEKFTGTYGQVEFKPIPYMFLVGSVRYDDYRKGRTATSPRAGISIFPFANTDYNWTTIWSSYSEAFKAPNAVQLCCPIGNPDLKPEEAEGWEIGLKQRIGTWANLELNYYDTEYNEKIVVAPDPTAPWGVRYTNIDSSTSEGWELLGEVYPTEYLRLFVAYSHNESKDDKTGKFLVSCPKDIVNYGFAIEDFHGFTLTTLANYAHKIYLDTANSIEDGDRTVYHAKLLYRFHINNFVFEPFVSVENLTDKEYYNGYLIQEGRAWHCGATLTANF